MKTKFGHPSAAERKFATQLRKVAKHVGHITDIHAPQGVLFDPQGLTRSLAAYSELITPWAERVAATMLASVSQSNLRGWTSMSRTIGAELRANFNTSEAGAAARALHTEQVGLITSLPTEAATRAQSLAQEAMLTGGRPNAVAAEIARTGEVTESRATLIARTETAKSNAAFTQARAENIGVTHYVWQTMQDESVRESHQEMQGTVQEFADPPEVDEFGAYNPGEVPNCRCFAEPIIDLPEEE